MYGLVFYVVLEEIFLPKKNRHMSCLFFIGFSESREKSKCWFLKIIIKKHFKLINLKLFLQKDLLLM